MCLTKSGNCNMLGIAVARTEKNLYPHGADILVEKRKTKDTR